MAKLLKPRTNADAADFWARHLALDTTCEERWTNSIHLTGGTIYSFGSHFPMAKCWRDEHGRVRRVVVNADRWNKSKGWADTNTDLSNVLRACQEHSPVRVEEIPLTFHAIEELRVLPKASDPEPDYPWRCEVPTVFYVRNPGPEPVDDGVGCIAGRVEVYEVQTTNYDFSSVFGEHPSEYLHPKVDSIITDEHGEKTYRWKYVRAETVTRLHGSSYSTWGDEHYKAWSEANGKDPWRHDPNVEYRRCPHCAAFAAKHEAWVRAMKGPGRGQCADHGYELYRAMIARFGDYKAWERGRRDAWRAMKEGRAAWQAWHDRNYIPPGLLPRDEDGVIAVTWGEVRERRYGNYVRTSPLALRKDAEAILKARREREREAARVARAEAEELRVRRMAQRALERRRKRRERSHRFEILASNVAVTLANMKGRASQD